MNEAPSARLAEPHGLVLAGGRSNRMGRDKSTLIYQDRPQTEICFHLLERVCASVYISNRTEQHRTAGHTGYPQLHDHLPQAGPIAGLIAAFARDPDQAWLALACDMPLMDLATLRFLVEHRDARRCATAFRNPRDGRPEPLCAIYEPALGARLMDFYRRGISSPRLILMQSDTLLLEAPDPGVLSDADSPDDAAAARRYLPPSP